MADWSGRPAYLQLADDLRAGIRTGRFAPASRLPSYGDLMKHYGVSITVVRSAIRELSTESLVHTHQGKGVFVSDPLPIMKTSETGSAGSDVDRLAWTESELRGLRDRVTAVEEDNADLRALIMDLYGRMGQPYPRGASKGVTPRERTG
jgi:DNA-binding GntR family transcriptional regulator